MVLLIVGIILVVAVGIYIYTKYIPGGVFSGLGRVKMLPSEYWATGTQTFYLDKELMTKKGLLENTGRGQEAIGFNIPDGTEIKAPFDGVYYPIYRARSGEGDFEDYEELLGMELNIPNTTSSVVVLGAFLPFLDEGADFKKGDVIGAKILSAEPHQEGSEYNLIIYAVDYDLQKVFKQ